jgi:hypothetical protein
MVPIDWECTKDFDFLFKIVKHVRKLKLRNFIYKKKIVVTKKALNNHATSRHFKPPRRPLFPFSRDIKRDQHGVLL